MVKAVLYCRVSSDGQVDGVSLDEQEQVGRMTCERLGWEPVATYREEGRSASKPDLAGRPELLRLLAAADRGEFRAVVVLNDTRYARHMVADSTTTARLLAAGVRYVATETGVDDLSTAEGLLMRAVKSYSSQKDSEHRTQAVLTCKRGIAKQGKWAKMVRPFGYRWQKGPRGESGTGRPVEDEGEGRTVRLIFELAAKKRLRPEAICKELRARGLRTRTGANWQPQVVANIIGRPLYKGEWTTDGTTPWAEASPAMVSAKMWRRAQIAVAGRRRTRRNLAREFLLQGMCTCGHCGSSLVICEPREGYRYYRCNKSAVQKECPSHHIPAGDLEAKVWSEVRPFIENPALVRRCVEDTREAKLPEWRERLADVENAIGACDDRIAKVLEGFEIGLYSEAQAADRKAAVLRERQRWEQEQADLRGRIAEEETRAEAIANTEAFLRRVRTVEGLSFQERRDLLAALGVEVKVWEQEARAEMTWHGHVLPVLAASEVTP